MVNTYKYTKINTVLKKPSEIIIYLNSTQGPHYASKIAKNIDVTLGYICRIVRKLEKRNIVEIIENKSCIKEIRLTEKGKILSERILKIQRFLDEPGFKKDIS